MTAITKTITGGDGLTTTLTWIMPSQTTPFVPTRSKGDPESGTDMPASCSLSVYCRSLSYYLYSMHTATHTPHPLDGQHCLGVQSVSGFYHPGIAGVGYDDACWPVNYFELFPSEWADLNSGEQTDKEGDRSTVAFPGGQCLQGWTTACTTTITAGDGGKETYPQAWCCPPGQWTCATATAEWDKAAPQRLCQSALTGTAVTQVWMYWDPAYYTFGPFGVSGTTSTLVEAYTWTADVSLETDPAHAATVFRKVFPLVLSSEAGDTGDVTVLTTVLVTPEAATPIGTYRKRTESKTPSPSLSGGDVLSSRDAVANILCAAFAAAAVMLLGFAMLYRSRSKRRRTDRRRREVVAADAAFYKEPFESDDGRRGTRSRFCFAHRG
ncbi:hypothetical protein GGS26DRAFT_217460 [Hypomontagnella submonticulosa]|nr:hypothetical protein GGS26DRAFT_217460 [Hypomontagnella submonticulosa]